ncbi:MAG: YceI family protein [Bacteroidales bacterium]
MKKRLFFITAALLLMGFTSFAQEFKVNTVKSELKWTGKKVTGEHLGFIAIKEGKLIVKKDKITSGEFIIDMNNMTCKDLTDETYNQKLIGHLKSDDFFSVEKYPTAKLVINESGSFAKGEATVNGKLTIKNITHPITFKATKSGNTYVAKITVDRSKYEVKYGSGKFFAGLGDNLIYDDFILDVKLVVE